MDVRTALEEALGPDAVLTDRDLMEPYARDWSGAAARYPELVVRPKTTEEVQAILRIANRLRVPVTPRGLGSGKAAGALADRGIVLSTEKLTGIVELNAPDLLVVARAGTRLSDIQAAVEAEGLFYPPDPGGAHLSSIGGNVACNAGGPRALKYGVTRNWVLGLEAVMATGDVVRTGSRAPKHVAGYDLTGLLVGSEGTLAVVTEVTLRLRPLPLGACTALIAFADVRSASQAVTAVLGSGLLPRALELLDETATRALAGDAPHLARLDDGALLIVETDGHDDDAALAELARVVEVLEARGASRVDVAQTASERERVWAPRRMLSESLRATAPLKRSEDVSVPRSRIPDLLDELRAVSSRTGVRIAAYGHAGDGNLHVNVLFSGGQDDRAHEALVSVAKIAVKLRGTISGEHGVGLLKRDLMALEQSELLLEIQRQVKAAVDPNGILNPDKVLPARRSP
jgi:glycolate oxidase